MPGKMVGELRQGGLPRANQTIAIESVQTDDIDRMHEDSRLTGKPHAQPLSHHVEGHAARRARGRPLRYVFTHSAPEGERIMPDICL